MPETPAPLLFHEILNIPGQWKELRKVHALNDKDFAWLSHVSITTHALRSEQSPPMIAESIQINIGTPPLITLAGCFILSATPDDKGSILYTPYDGIKKYDTRKTLETLLVKRLENAGEEDSILAFLALSQRKTIVGQSSLSLEYAIIDGDVFEHQKDTILKAQQLNAEQLLSELKRLPSITSLLDTILDDLLKSRFPNLRQAQTRVNFYTASPDSDGVTASGRHRNWHDSASLSEAVLMLHRQQNWPVDQLYEFSNPRHVSRDGDQSLWDEALKKAAGKLLMLLFHEMEGYWDTPAKAGSSRRTFFGEVLKEQARAELIIKRESGIIDARQFTGLHQMIRCADAPTRRLSLENVRLWEYEPNYVELAGSLMISHAGACLYTPTMGLQVLKDYSDLKDTILSKFRAAGHQDELYGLLSLEERKRFIGFDHPQVTGERIGGDLFNVLFEAIITKQRQNIEYALQVFRLSDGTVDIHALFDKALDIRTMIHARLLNLDAAERWSTRPVLAGPAHPSEVLADKARALARSCKNIDALLTGAFRAQPTSEASGQRHYLESMKSQLAHALFMGVTGEAALRVLSGSLKTAEQAIVDTVFHADQPSRNNRRSLNGFIPDAWSLTLDSPQVKEPLSLAHCVLVTERGGLDGLHSGRVILWTPALGLEVFVSIVIARQTLEKRLKDRVARLSLLENLLCKERRFHQQYTLGALRLIEDNVLQNRMQSGIEHFLARCDTVRERLKGRAELTSALNILKRTVIDTNLVRTIELAEAINQQQSLPAWLGMAPMAQQQFHLELLEQWRHSVIDHMDYLSGLPSLTDYVNETLKTLLSTRFAGNKPDPQDIEITPDPAWAAPARSLTEFALDPVSTAPGSGFTVASKTTEALPVGLDQTSVRQLVLSLAIPTTFAERITEALSDGHAQAAERKQRFIRQLPWQLLQHAHGMKLQQKLSASAFDFICQVLDIPDGIARTTVEGAHAIVYPLSLIKTQGSTAVETLGLYIIAPGSGHQGPLVLYTPYADEVFHEFANEASLIAAVNTPGNLQDLVIRRLPAAQQSVFRGLLQSSVGETSEMKLAVNLITGNLLIRLFSDNRQLLSRLLNCQSQSTAQSDWEAAKQLFSRGIALGSRLLPGKLSYLTFLWQAYKHFKDSAQDLQDHHWTQALKSFISGGVQMLSLGRLAANEELSDETPTSTPDSTSDKSAKDIVSTSNASAPQAPSWSRIKITSPLRTGLKPFETAVVALEDLKRDTSNGTYEDPISKRTYAPIAGKVVRVEQPGAVWQVLNDEMPGPSLCLSGSRLVLAPDRHAVHYGKAMSKLHNRTAITLNRWAMLSVEAEGMKEIRRDHPEKARMIEQAVDMARFYAFNCLHNLALVKSHNADDRVTSFLKDFFGVQQVDAGLLSSIKKTIVPICNALVDPSDDLLDTGRFVVGSNLDNNSTTVAFVLGNDNKKTVHLTELFFSPGLDFYESFLSEPFDIDGHAQAATLIHEFAHQFAEALDIASLEARRPFADLINTGTVQGLAMKSEQDTFQKQALSLDTPRDELFARWSKKKGAYITLDKSSDSGAATLSKKILEITRKPTIEEARDAFLDENSPEVRIDVILQNADSIARLICEVGRRLDPVSTAG
ncbi:MAG TPA: DUF6543 domain-containing protein [Pseudomonas sp.]|uniref:dermonecrotic toxin domain-containing protein n=1 Tax=Pseudomonas sp. TaxID=306 RepID=UPI002D17F4B9|nr:DUF6543 domain-containing protein [Pseudomonas sp.]HWH89552.1 DUF6543 domain-containing protein [Pseudomonas sp.]